MGELDAPSFKPAEYTKLSNEGAKKEIEMIQKYIEAMEEALIPINKALAKASQLEEVLQPTFR